MLVVIQEYALDLWIVEVCLVVDDVGFMGLSGAGVYDRLLGQAAGARLVNWQGF